MKDWREVVLKLSERFGFNDSALTMPGYVLRRGAAPDTNRGEGRTGHLTEAWPPNGEFMEAVARYREGKDAQLINYLYRDEPLGKAERLALARLLTQTPETFCTIVNETIRLAVRKGWLAHNFLLDHPLTPPKKKHKKRPIMSPAEVERLLIAASDRGEFHDGVHGKEKRYAWEYRLFVIALVLSQYPRRQDIAALHWEDVDWVGGTIMVTRFYSYAHWKKTGCYFKPYSKTNKQRSLQLVATTRAALQMIWERQGRPAEGLILQSHSGKPIYGQMREEIFLYVMRKAGMVTFENGRRNGRGKYNFHDLRRTGETMHLRRVGLEHLEEIAETADHSPATALKYYIEEHRDGTVQRAALEMAVEHGQKLLPPPDGYRKATGDYQAARYLAKNNRFTKKR
jgi:integrase